MKFWRGFLSRKQRALSQISDVDVFAAAHDAPQAVYDTQQLIQHARLLSRHHEPLPGVKVDDLLECLRRHGVALDAAFHTTRRWSADNHTLEPAAEWLVDNFYLIREQIKEIRAGLPSKYGRRLPTLVSGKERVPRSLVLMRELVRHTDGNINLADVQLFIGSYQEQSRLTLGELWSIPLMLRYALIERLRPLSDAIISRVEDVKNALEWSIRLHEVSRKSPAEVVIAMAAMVSSGVRFTPAFVTEFQRQMQDDNPACRLIMLWLDQQLSARHLSVPEAMEVQSKIQVAEQVSISNCISTIRAIRRGEWLQLIESVSVVEASLRNDPAGVYAHMDPATRDRYRHVLEGVARRCNRTEWDVATAVVGLAVTHQSDDSDLRQHHVGYWLLDGGQPELVQKLGLQRNLRERVSRWQQDNPSIIYVTAIVALTGILASISIPGMQQFSFLHASVVVMAVLIAMSHASIAIINWLVTLWVAPHRLLRMDFNKGIPDASRALVVVPCLLGSKSEVNELVSALEVRYLANRDTNLYFALLADFNDAPQREMPGDAELLREAREEIEALNRKHDPQDRSRFCLFIRDREWNLCEQLWMGRERKRGKLVDLNRFLRGRACGTLRLCVGAEAELRRVKYVITLDADTDLPPQSATQLVATMAHPLNRPLIDRRRRRVIAGYGILQPLISSEVSIDNTSRLAQLYGGEAGIDPYTRVVSDVYQDLFGEASFVGKGIYDVDIFAQATGTRFPSNLILSHDLLEGNYARTGLVSDVALFEHHPDSYIADLRRRHRWVRGDWQILSWVLPWVPGPRGRWVRNSLSSHQRTKILDNLRRSLVPPALLALDLNGWLFSMQPDFWTLILLGVVFISPLLISIQHLTNHHPRMAWRVHFRLNGEDTLRRLKQASLLLVMLPIETQVHLDAIARSLWRLLVSGRRRLEWTPASVIARSRPVNLAGYFRMLWAGPALAISVLIALALLQGSAFAQLVALPLLLVWFLSPWLAWFISQPYTTEIAEQLDPEQRRFLGAVARRTWAFFERFVTADSNHLPPDNLQCYPSEQIADRTSPTNIGMYLVSALSAYDFGYISVDNLLDRVAATLDTLEKLPRYRGHFLNWYDGHTLAPLQPRYVSSVDSGNLLGCLLVLARGLDMLQEQRMLPGQVWRGLRDEWQLFKYEAGAALSAHSASVAAVKLIEARLRQPPEASAPLSMQLASLSQLAESAQSLQSSFAPSGEASRWLTVFRVHVQQLVAGVSACAAWLQEPTPEALDETLIRQLEELDRNPSWRHMQILADDLLAATDNRHQPLAHALGQALDRSRRRCQLAEQLATRCRALTDVEYDFLCLPGQPLLSIGFNIERNTLDEGSYDLLASEARLASFVGIAQGRLSRRNWVALGRLLTLIDGRPVLVSWSGSMFEYLMPLLLMPSFENTLLTRTCRTVVERQIAYGREYGVPWGVSEAGYNARDINLVYQYRAFGVPGLGLKRGLADDLVITPYASALALLLRPVAACDNLRRLADIGAMGDLGFFESLDYTPARLSEGAPFALVQSYMAHHQGMILTALSAALNDWPLQKRFLREPMFRANRLLLQEKVPAALLVDADTLRPDDVPELKVAPGVSASVITQLDTSVPQLQLLSNGRYHVLISQTGGGYSLWGEQAVNQWREDPVCDQDGIFCYVQDLDRTLLWSASMQPTRVASHDYEAIFSQAGAEFRRRDHGIETHTHVAVSAEDDIELRSITVTNYSGARRRLALTSYLEWVLTRQSDQSAHPVFNKLFVETEQVAECQAILARRRPRSADEHTPTFFHLMAVAEPDAGGFSFETRRNIFVGRSGSLAFPAALATGTELANGVGAVLDPIAAIRRELVLEPGQSIRVDMVTGAADDRETARTLVERYATGGSDKRVFDMAWTREQVIGHQLGLGVRDRKLFARMASSVVYCDPQARVHRMWSVPAAGQSGLWKYGISGDLPIVLLRVGSARELPLVRQMLVAHSYWRMHGIRVDLVIWNEDVSGYRQELQDRIMGLIGSSIEASTLDRPGGVFVRRAELLAQDDRALLLASARIVINGKHGPLSDQLPRQSVLASMPAPLMARPLVGTVQDGMEKVVEELRLFNGTGGYSADGREYVICLPPGQDTPRPWVNVLASPHFGSVISERGSAYTFADNAHEFRLTPWGNDPVLDSGGEAFYLRDDDDLLYWSPTAWPVRGVGTHVARHGFGYSEFHTVQHGIESDLTAFVAVDAAVKYSVLKMRNVGTRDRSLSLFGYVEWVLGDHRARMAPHIRSAIEPRGCAVLACNSFNDDFSGRRGVFAMSAEGTATADRSEFIGRNGSLTQPAALCRQDLLGRFGGGLDPCAALKSAWSLKPGEACEVVFVLGVANDAVQARALYREHATPQRAARELDAVKARWSKLLGTVDVRTPDAATNLLLNGWLTYQVIASRLWARSGFYQSGGAYGFRDQLQDSVSLLDVDPGFAREQILRAAAHQFSEGDVQHWWHPPHGRGVRTRISDDYLWLPWAVAQYVEASGDRGILNTAVPFLDGRKLEPDEESWYDVAEPGSYGSIYQHCTRAILHGLRFGERGLPLMGGGDWNDGMNLLGLEGRGESVWLGFFLIDVLRRFAPLAAAYGDPIFEMRCIEEAAGLAQRIENTAWDGAWYRRAWADDGQVVGSRDSEECRIDSLPQSWAALTGTGTLERREQALDSTMELLVRRDHRLVQLFDPPFDDGPLEPGYIKGYIPGIRENGGQYTHAAVWLGMACVTLGRCESAWEILDIINPINHARDRAGVERYQIEPYVLAADVYWADAYRGQGGWSWYTGSAGWLRHFMLESLLGLVVRDGWLSVRPCPHPQWHEYRLHYRFGNSLYRIVVMRQDDSQTAPGLTLDGQPVAGDSIELVDDGLTHHLQKVLANH